MKPTKFLFPACCLTLFAAWALVDYETIKPLDVTIPLVLGPGDEEEEEEEEEEEGGFNILRHKLFFPNRAVEDTDRSPEYEAVLGRYGV